MEVMNSDYYKVWWQAHMDGYDTKELLYSIGPDQMASKKMLVDNLPLDEIKWFETLKIEIWGGWFGYPLIDLLLEKVPNIHRITNIDIDEKALALCKRYTNVKGLSKIVEYKCQSVMDPIEGHEDTRLVINTSGEHMPNLKQIVKNKNYKANCIFALQSNNMFHVAGQHINCVNNSTELREQSGLGTVWTELSCEMKNGYERYMVIGRK